MACALHHGAAMIYLSHATSVVFAPRCFQIIFVTATHVLSVENQTVDLVLSLAVLACRGRRRQSGPVGTRMRAAARG